MQAVSASCEYIVFLRPAAMENDPVATLRAWLHRLTDSREGALCHAGRPATTES